MEKLWLVHKELDTARKEISELKRDADRRGGLEGELREKRDKHYERAQALRGTVKEEKARTAAAEADAAKKEAEASAQAKAAAAADEQVRDLEHSLQRYDEAFKAAQQSSDARIGELEELLEFQEREWESEMSKWKEAEKAARESTRAYKPPQAHAWELLTEGGQRWARKADIDFMVGILELREWRSVDVSTALSRVGMLEEVFDTSEVWSLRISWMNTVLDRVEQQHWNADLTASMAIAMNLSSRNLDKMRKLTGKEYDPYVDRYNSITIAENPWPHRSFEVVRLRSPFRPRSQWVPRLQQMRSMLRTEVSEDGQTASRSLIEESLRMLERDREKIQSGCGKSAATPLEVHMTADGFPVTGFSLLHTCISNAGRKPQFLTHSEAELVCLLISRRAENNTALKTIFCEVGITSQWNLTRRLGFIEDGVDRLYVRLSFAADKKGVEANRGAVAPLLVGALAHAISSPKHHGRTRTLIL